MTVSDLADAIREFTDFVREVDVPLRAEDRAALQALYDQLVKMLEEAS